MNSKIIEIVTGRCHYFARLVEQLWYLTLVIGKAKCILGYLEKEVYI